MRLVSLLPETCTHTNADFEASHFQLFRHGDRHRDASHLSVRFILTAGVVGSAGILELLMMGDAVPVGRCGVEVLTSFREAEPKEKPAGASDEGLGALNEKLDEVELREKRDGATEP